MKISNLSLNNIINQDEGLKQGSIVKAKILEMTEEFILIDIKGHGVTKATLESDLTALKGEEVSFIVKSIMDNKIELKTLFNNEDLKEHLSNYGNKDNSISLLLKNLNIKETDSSVSLVEKLMAYKVSINEDNLNDAIKTFDKLIQLTNLSEDDKVILLSEPALEEKSMLKLDQTAREESVVDIKDNQPNEIGQNTINKHTLESSSLKDENTQEIILPEKVNVKNLLVVEKDDYLQKEDLSALVKEVLGNSIENKEELIKIISFFTKNNIKASLNNIKNLKELNEDPVKFSKSFEKINLLTDIFKKDNIFKTSDSIENNFNLIKENIEKNSTKVDELKSMIDNIKDNTKINLKENIKTLENKIDFLKDMNKDLSFLFLPINFGKKDLEGALTILKGKKKKNSGDNKTNIFINLNTENLGSIKISCESISNILSVKINIKKEDLELFQSMEENLIHKISTIGYKIDKINFESEKDLQIIDSMASNSNPTYFLDIKV